MKRAAIEKNRTRRVWRQHYTNHLKEVRGPYKPEDSVRCDCDKQVNRFRKGQRVFGCGRPRCLVCHYDKLMGVPTKNDLRANLKFKEELEDDYRSYEL